MLRKNLIIIGAVAALITAILIPPVRAAAESALSVFRVGDAHTIRISVTDLQEMAELMEEYNALLEPEAHDMPNARDDISSQVKELTSLREFTGFPVSLPSALSAQTPELYALDARTETVTLDTAELNAALTKLGAAMVDDSLSGAVITVSMPPVLMAEYADVALIATQTVAIDASDDTLSALKEALLSVPAIPENLRVQLLPIDPKTRDIYLPVIEGLGRETALAGATGYIYATGDLAQVLSMIPQAADAGLIEGLSSNNAAALVWTKDGVLYCLLGDKSDSELSRIARTVR